MLLFVVDMVDNGYVTLDAEQADTLSSAKAQMIMGKQQLEGADFDRMLVYLTLPEAGEETYRFTDTIRDVAQSHYPKGQVYVVGNSTNQFEFLKSFQIDNVVVNVVSILIVLVVLLFTFKSAGMPVLLILVIQGAIWMNFSYPTLAHKDVFFLTQLVVSSIQMGANIDYAIVIANRYTDNTRTMRPKEAIIEAMNFAFPTILTSGTILATSGILISIVTTECTINGIGDALGRGTIISICLVMFVLPQILILGGKILEKTSFSMPAVSREKHANGLVAVDGLIVGEIRGNVNGVFRGTIDGEVNVRLLSGKIGEDEESQTDSPAETGEEAPPEPVPAEKQMPRTDKAVGEEDEADD
jgi:predicted RND superfamily exporter protein